MLTSGGVLGQTESVERDLLPGLGFPTTAHSQFHRAQRMPLKRRRGRLGRRVLLPWLFFCQGYSASPIQDTYGIPTKLARQTGYLDTPAASIRWIGGGWERRGEENLKCSASARLIITI
ncbi:hypothetical protein I7I48_06554 [Histoplasma ohiense]|nr:hypothetical protein I7I48_06554 [Histoplasma ohiense (nom. inval.)]